MASNWYQTGEPAYATSMTFVDKDSIRASGDIRQARLYMVLAAPDEQGASAVEALMEFDCARPQTRFMRLAGFDDAGRRLDEGRGSQRWAPVTPGSQQSVSYRFVCSGGTSLDAAASYGADYPFARARALMARHRAEDIRDSR